MVPQLRINSVQGRISIHSSLAKIEIHSNHAEQTIQQPKAELHIDRTPSKLSIDQTQAWNNLNLKSAFVRIRDAASAGHQAAMEGIARRAEQGDELMEIENGGNPIVSQAVENSEHYESYDTGSVPPFEAVKIHYQSSQLDIQWQTHAPIISAKQNHPTINYQPGQVNIYMDQYPSLSIQVAGGQINTTA